jgi:hypothetical protein
MAVLYSTQMGIKYTNIFHSKALQNLPKLDFWFENIPSGNPGVGRVFFRKMHLSKSSKAPSKRSKKVAVKLLQQVKPFFPLSLSLSLSQSLNFFFSTQKTIT